MVRESQKKARDKWDSENMSVLGCKLKKAHADKFRAYAKEKVTTANALLKDYVLKTIGEKE